MIMVGVFLIHYSEIGLKGQNRPMFEKKLVENINRSIKRYTQKKAKRRYGRIVLEAEEKSAEYVAEKLSKVLGIKYFAVANVAELDIENIKKVALEVISGMEFETFKVQTVRANKAFPLTSMDVNRVVGEHVIKHTGKKVRMKDPDVMIFIEICEKEAYIYTEKIHGLGGLPVSVSGKVVALLSGGIDSPVASFLLMKRGCKVVLVHFFNETLHSAGVRKKIEELARKLGEYQNSIKLYMVSFGDVQREIIKHVPSSYRMIIYRRFMMCIASKIAIKEGAKALVTGDNIAQVASQTLDNLEVIYDASEFPVFTPLAGFDKEEIVEIAKKIGTYSISIQPYADCCSFMVARHPETRAKLEFVKNFESRMDVDQLVNDALENTEILEFKG